MNSLSKRLVQTGLWLVLLFDKKTKTKTKTDCLVFVGHGRSPVRSQSFASPKDQTFKHYN